LHGWYVMFVWALILWNMIRKVKKD
jgi:hypothetical protein